MTVVGLGAWCDLATESERVLSFDVREFAVLADGRRLTLHAERGFSSVVNAVGGPPPRDPWHGMTLETLERDVRTTVLPDDDDGEEHPWDWLAGLLRGHGVEASAEELRLVPYEVEFSQRLRARLAAKGPPPAGTDGSAGA